MEIVVLSGKGGVGKSMISALLLYELRERAIAVDADVEANNLHVWLGASQIITQKHLYIRKKPVFKGGEIFTDCPFNAIQGEHINPYLCEGCGLCAFKKPHSYEMVSVKTATLITQRWKYGLLHRAQLEPGEKNSGRVVDELKKTLNNNNLYIIDGPPGVGCPATSALKGADFAIIVVEPTLPSLRYAQRVAQLCEHFNVNYGFVLNKQGIGDESVKDAINERLLATFPYSPSAIHHLINNTVEQLFVSQRKLLLKNIVQNTNMSLISFPDT
jgi:MinD superfamily P-loop ATPase